MALFVCELGIVACVLQLATAAFAEIAAQRRHPGLGGMHKGVILGYRQLPALLVLRDVNDLTRQGTVTHDRRLIMRSEAAALTIKPLDRKLHG